MFGFVYVQEWSPRITVFKKVFVTCEEIVSKEDKL